jgi:hypothetical protein
MNTATVISSTTYQIVAEPIRLFDSRNKLQNVRLTATCADSSSKDWTASFEQLSQSLAEFVGLRRGLELCGRLQCGQRMTLPGNYTAADLVVLGFRSNLTARY